jgi:hypothetical protein
MRATLTPPFTSGKTAQQWHETDEAQPFAQVLVAASRQAQQFLPAFRPDRRDEPASLAKLFQQLLRHGMRCGGDEDRIEWRL